MDVHSKTEDATNDIEFVYCMQHCRVHSTGWCSVSNDSKIPLFAKNEKDANDEWNRKKYHLKAFVFYEK